MLAGTKQREARRMDRLLALAWLNVVLHLMGLLAAFLWLGPGTPLAPLDERLAYLAARPGGWAAGWTLWACCALALVAFVAEAGPRMARGGPLALSLAAAGLAIDLPCDILYVAVLPALAQPGQPTPLFLVLERALSACGTVGANTLYTAAVLLLLGEGWARLGPLARAAGLFTVAGGAAMAAAGALDSVRGVAAATGPMVVAFSAFVLAYAAAPADGRAAR